MSDYRFKNRKETHSTIIISECKTECGKCPVIYYPNDKSMEFCMCRCHSHAAPTPPEKEPKVGIGTIE